MDGSNEKETGPVVLSVSGMTCAGCASTVTRLLSRVRGVADVRVDFGSGRAVVTGEARPDDLIAAIETAGYGAQLSRDMTLGGEDERGRSGCC